MHIFRACPVPLNDYIESVKRQSVEAQKPKAAELKKAFADLLINPHMLDRLGPAVNSGRGMFLYGYPGNGKTSIAERVTAAFGKHIWIPRAIDIDGDIMRVFDRMSHEEDMPKAGEGLLDQSGFDKRWIRIRRPTIIAGGELTMDMLEVQSNKTTHVAKTSAAANEKQLRNAGDRRLWPSEDERRSTAQPLDRAAGEAV